MVIVNQYVFRLGPAGWENVKWMGQNVKCHVEYHIGAKLTLNMQSSSAILNKIPAAKEWHH